MCMAGTLPARTELTPGEGKMNEKQYERGMSRSSGCVPRKAGLVPFGFKAFLLEEVTAELRDE